MSYNIIMEKKVRVGLALGSGGLCGVAHVGFLQVLEENGIKVDMVSGISMGAIVGGLYASGVSPKELEEIALKIEKKDILGLNAFKVLKESVFTGKKIENFLNKLVKVKNIEDADIQFYAQAVDLMNGTMHTFDKGSIVDAMRASSAIPGLLSPVYLNDTCYIDGGSIDTVPFKILKDKGADVVIAVNCLNNYKLDKKPKGSLSTFLHSYDVLAEQLWKLNKRLYKDYYDVYCFDNTEGVNPISIDIENIKKLLESGRQSAYKYLDKIKQIIQKKQNNLENSLDLS